MTNPLETGKGKTRIDYLDGIRGWGAVAVLLSHTIIFFLMFSTPFLHYGEARIAADISSSNYLDLFPGLVLNFGSMPFRMELDITGIYGLGDPEVAGRVAMGWVASS